jgi:excisionase family DNA binding protein
MLKDGDDMEHTPVDGASTIYTEWSQVPLTMTPAQAGTVVGLSAETIRALIRSESLPALRIGDKYLIVRDRLRTWLEESDGRVLDSVVESRTQARQRQSKGDARR